MAESSSAALTDNKPVIVRVKRKAFQSALDAFWLEINERPLKRPLIDFGKLSIQDASSSKIEEQKTKKILVRHVETVTSTKDTFDVLRSFMPNSSGDLKSEERRRSLKSVNIRDQLWVKARQRQEVLSRSARFEQIWTSRKGKKEAPENEAVYDMCRLYDVVRVDVEEHTFEVPNKKNADMEDYKKLADFLPLLREVSPTAAEEIECDIHDVMSEQDGYVYDVYAVEDDAIEMEDDSTSLFPLVQVDDDDTFYDGPDDSEYESADSNAENNPLNDYPDEESEEEDEYEVTSRSSDEKSEGESTTSENPCEELDSGIQFSDEYEGSEWNDMSDYGDQTFEDWEEDDDE